MQKARAQDVIAPFRVALIGVDSTSERGEFDKSFFRGIWYTQQTHQGFGSDRLSHLQIFMKRVEHNRGRRARRRDRCMHDVSGRFQKVQQIVSGRHRDRGGRRNSFRSGEPVGRHHRHHTMTVRAAGSGRATAWRRRGVQCAVIRRASSKSNAPYVMEAFPDTPNQEQSSRQSPGWRHRRCPTPILD